MQERPQFLQCMIAPLFILQLIPTFGFVADQNDIWKSGGPLFPENTNEIKKLSSVIAYYNSVHDLLVKQNVCK